MLNKKDYVAMFENSAVDFSKSFLSKILVPTGRGGVYASRDYIHANAVIAAIKKYNGDPTLFQSLDDLKKYLPSGVNFRLNYYSPCLAYRYDELKTPQQEALFNDQRYLFTVKENGCRGWLIFTKSGNYLFSRNYSDVDCSLLDYIGNIEQKFNFEETFAIDVEIKYEPKGDAVVTEALKEFGIETTSKLEAMAAMLQMRPSDAVEIQRRYKERFGGDLLAFRLIYPLYFKGKNYIKRPIGEGHAIYDEVVAYARERGFNVQPIGRLNGSAEKKKAWLEGLLEAGEEGVVVHNLKSFYCTSENRDKDTFVKIKRSVARDNAMKGMGDTIEGFITGFKMSTEGKANEGLIGSFEVSIYLQEGGKPPRKHVIAYLPNITKEIKEQATITDSTGEVFLSEEFMNQVVEMDGQAISAKSMRLTHPRLLRFRFDKSEAECIYSLEWLKSQQV
jgi:ATP-dependent DNA ligase